MVWCGVWSCEVCKWKRELKMKGCWRRRTSSVDGERSLSRSRSRTWRVREISVGERLEKLEVEVNGLLKWMGEERVEKERKEELDKEKDRWCDAVDVGMKKMEVEVENLVEIVGRMEKLEEIVKRSNEEFKRLVEGVKDEVKESLKVIEEGLIGFRKDVNERRIEKVDDKLEKKEFIEDGMSRMSNLWEKMIELKRLESEGVERVIRVRVGDEMICFDSSLVRGKRGAALRRCVAVAEKLLRAKGVMVKREKLYETMNREFDKWRKDEER